MCRGGLPRGFSCFSAWATPPFAVLAIRYRSAIKQPFGSTSPETNLSRRAQPKSVLGSYREASHRGTSGGTAVMNLAWSFIVVSKECRPYFAPHRVAHLLGLRYPYLSLNPR